MDSINNTELEHDKIVSESIKFDKSRRCHVYFLVYKEIIVYVGKAINYQTRIHDHVRTKLFDSYYIAECTEDKLKEVESFYIAKFKPIYNVHENNQPKIENGTYIKHKDVLILNAGGYKGSHRKILDVKGNAIIDVFSSERIGWVINKVGYIYDKQYRGGINNLVHGYKWIMCSNGLTKIIKIPCNIPIFNQPNTNVIRIPYIKEEDIKDPYTLYIYSKVNKYNPEWFKNKIAKSKITIDDLVISIIDFLFVYHTIMMNHQNYFNPNHRNTKYKRDYSDGLINTPNEILNFWKDKNVINAKKSKINNNL